MEIVFRKLANDERTASSGELLLYGGLVSGEDRRDVSGLIVEQGLGGFPHGTGEITRIVIQADPTLDDLLACAFAERLVNGQALPEAAATFARYAALIREGLRPGNTPLEDSLEGMFLAIRSAAGKDLTQPDVASAFRSSWSRMASSIMQAIVEGVDPFNTSLFENNPEFSRERAFLAKDHEVYRQDVARGRQWLVKLPGGPPKGSGLILMQPKSLLWKYWSRQDRQAPTGEAFLFLGVCWNAGNWVFSTDPIQRLSLKSLAEELQAAEQKINPQTADEDPWFDGKLFGHTLIAAPKQGTALAEKQVLRIVSGWAQARPPRMRSGARRPAFAAMAASLLVAGALFLFFKGPRRPASSRTDDVVSRDVPPDSTVVSRGAGSARVSKGRSRLREGRSSLCLLNIGVSKYRQQALSLSTAHRDAEALQKAFAARAGGLFESVRYRKLLTDNQATQNAIFNALRELKRQMTESDLAVVTVSGHGIKDENGDYFFLPHDYDLDRDPRSTAVSWHQFMMDLGRMPGLVLVIMDTCHSGSVTTTTQLRGLDLLEMKGSIDAVTGNMRQQEGLSIIAASLGSQTAAERRDWGHGALTLAILEALDGRRLAKTGRDDADADADAHIARISADGLVTLEELSDYVRKRVRVLNGGRQAVATGDSGDLDFGSVFLARRKKTTKTKHPR